MEITNFYNYGTMNEVEAGATQIINYYGKGHDNSEEANQDMPDADQLANAILKVQRMFWANSAHAVLFCVLRDNYGYCGTRSQYEREVSQLPFSRGLDHPCTTGIISSTINDNKYMELPIEKWRENKAPNRVMKLVEAFKEALDAERKQ